MNAVHTRKMAWKAFLLYLASASLWIGCAAANDDVVARVGDSAISRTALEEAAAAEVLPLRLQVSEVYRAHLQRLIRDALFEQEAIRRGVSVEELIAEEIEAHVAEPTEEMLRAFYDEHQADLGAYGFEVVRFRLRQHLVEQAQAARERVVIQDLEKKQKVERLLEPIRFAIDTKGSASMGSKDAPVVIVAFSDFECPYCARGASTLSTLKDTYGERVRLVFRHFPLSFHVNGIPAAMAAECARDQGAFWTYHDRLFEDQDKLGGDDLLAHATALGLKRKPFETCMASESHRAKVESDIRTGSALGLSGAPAYFVNGRPVLGALPAEAFSDIIEEELAFQRK